MDKLQLKSNVLSLMSEGNQNGAIKEVLGYFDVDDSHFEEFKDYANILTVEEARQQLLRRINVQASKMPLNQTKVGLLMDRLEDVNQFKYTDDYVVMTNVADGGFISLKGWYLVNIIDDLTKEARV